MNDQDKIWTTVGSAGTLNQIDLANVSLHGSIVQLGADLTHESAAASATPHGGPTVATRQAVIRYNVTPVDGVFSTGRFQYQLQIRYRGQISAKLMEVDLATGEEKRLVLFDSSCFPATPNFQQRIATLKEDCMLVPVTEVSTSLDFTNKAYYVEATLTAPLQGNPAAISIIKLLAPPESHG
jgi:hypothetical protein